MVLSVPRYPEFNDIIHWSERQQFYIPELELSYGEVCNILKKCWRGYKGARHEQNTELQEHYADIIQGVVEALGYERMVFRIAESYDMFSAPEMPELDQITYQTAEEEVQLIDKRVEEQRIRQRNLAMDFIRKNKYDWDEITKQYVTYTTPEDEADQEYMLEMEDEVS